MQARHPYEYSRYGGTKNGWRKEGKKLSRDWVYVWAVENPKTGKVALVMGDCHSAAPTRVEPIETWFNRDRLRQLQGDDERDRVLMDDGRMWRVMRKLIDSGQIVLAQRGFGPVGLDFLETMIATEFDENGE